jgi:hypothetical protein
MFEEDTFMTTALSLLYLSAGAQTIVSQKGPSLGSPRGLP